MPIRILPAEVASQIAAGEVVERPASVVKELLENALDAGASFISINIEAAGKRLIEVIDNGSGIPAGEIALAVSRHATSKLVAAADLFHIATLGFRGEALASIASVSHLTLTSREPAAAAGTRLRVDGGQISKAEETGSPVGTSVRVEDLFYNVPARLKFLKSDLTERRQIDDLVTRYALAYPQARFHLRQDGKAVLQTSGNGERREVLAMLYGPEIARQMLEVLADGDGSPNGDFTAIRGFISPTTLTRSNRRDITFFVNGRWVQDAALTTALVQAYHTLVMVGRYPFGVLFLELAPEAVDVNVHPAKSEVRFRERDRVFSAVQRAVRRALLAHSPVAGLDVSSLWERTPEAGRPGFNRQMSWEAPAPDRSWDQSDSSEDTGEPSAAATSQAEAIPQQQAAAPLGAPILRLIGQIAATYLVAEGPDGLYLIDQHAAHERVLFERFMSQLSSRIPAQILLEPAVVDLPPASARLMAEQLHLLDKIGFQVEPFGSQSFLVRAVPSILARSDPGAALRVLVEDFEEDETPLQAETEARIIARICKRAAVKAGQSLSGDEQRNLLADLEACRSPRTCPHGRPTMIHLPVDLLERQFGRKGAR